MPKRTKQIDAEISDVLSAPAIAKTTSHSVKGLATLAIMGTVPAQWSLTPIRWIEEEREVMGQVTCPTCHGGKFVRIEDGRVIAPPSDNSSDGFDYRNAARRDALRAGRTYGNCPTCAKRKGGWGLIPQGKVAGLVRERVMVGYPKFPSGTRFDSRFFAGMHCNLCNKLIMKSHCVPVHATGDDGVTHGMFVGEDCAKKFLDVKLKRAKGSIVETET
jgi:hypothetical protein